MQKAISSITATLLLILITVTAAIFMYAFIMGFIGSTESTTTELASPLKIEGVKIIETDEGTLIYVWVRNIGDTKVKVNAIYVGIQGSYTLAKLAYSSSSPLIWGGDIWEFKPEIQTIEKVENGLIFYEDFRDGYNKNEWVEINTLES